MSGTSFDLPLFVAVMGVAAVASAYLVIRARDLVYASVALAVLGSLTASILALLGLGIVAAYIVLVYVGAAVMFIIITISMLGPTGMEEQEAMRGVIVASPRRFRAYTGLWAEALRPLRSTRFGQRSARRLGGPQQVPPGFSADIHRSGRHNR